MKEIILQHYKIYNKMQIRDFYKLVYQNNFGSTHIISKSKSSLERLQYECQNLDFSYLVKGEPMLQSIGNKLMRVNLRLFLMNGGCLEKLNNAFVETSILHKTNEEKFMFDIIKLKHLIGNEIDTYEPVESLDKLARDRQIVSHTVLYNELYSPAYRVVLESFASSLFNFSESKNYFNSAVSY